MGPRSAVCPFKEDDRHEAQADARRLGDGLVGPGSGCLGARRAGLGPHRAGGKSELPGPARASEPLYLGTGIPSFLQAKIARYEAKAFSALEGGDGTIHTEKDVISRQTGNALQRTCTTDVASNTVVPTVGPSGRYGPGAGGDQIAVLRGDVVTICK